MSTKTKTYIYGLVDPFDMKIKYIGQSVAPLDRLNGHSNDIYSYCGNAKLEWIKRLKRSKSRPYLLILEKIFLNNAHIIETKYIKKWRGSLLNTRLIVTKPIHTRTLNKLIEEKK